jgi:hypothetical protein
MVSICHSTHHIFKLTTNKQKHTIGTKKYQPYHWSGEFEIMNDLLNTKRMERAMAYPNCINWAAKTMTVGLLPQK